VTKENFVAVRDLFQAAQMTCLAKSWDAVTALSRKLAKEAMRLVNEGALPVVVSSDMNENYTPLSQLSHHVDIHLVLLTRFVLVRYPGMLYLVDTDGYNECRYVVELPFVVERENERWVARWEYKENVPNIPSGAFTHAPKGVITSTRDNVLLWKGEVDRPLRVYGPCPCGCSSFCYISASNDKGQGATIKFEDENTARAVARAFGLPVQES
jgi:hypothetical protein